MSKIEPGLRMPSEKKEELRLRLEELKERIGVLQRNAREKGVPIVIIFEGWDIWRMADKVNNLIRALDPRGYELHFVDETSKDEEQRPFIWKYFIGMPQKGSIAVFDRSWYFRLVDDFYDTENRYNFDSRIDDIKMMEEQHAKEGWLFVKFFLDLSKKEFRKRVEKNGKKDTCKRVMEIDGDYSEDYDDVRPIWDEVLKKTNFPFAPWTVLEDGDEDETMMHIFEWVISSATPMLDSYVPRACNVKSGQLRRMPSDNLLDKVDLAQRMEQDEYRKEIDRLQKKLGGMQCKLKASGRSAVLVFEGWDASGKGGAIIRLTQELNPRGYMVAPIGAPNDLELQHHYLWRFYRSIPRTGDIVIFDRSWYGRVLVERVECLAEEEDLRRSYGEIRDFERMLTKSGCIVMKFWLHIDEETQLKRFKEREQDPFKKWKITEDDWRNREKWQIYEEAVEDMLAYTDDDEAPWIIVPSNDKYYSRITVLRSVLDRLENELD